MISDMTEDQLTQRIAKNEQEIDDDFFDILGSSRMRRLNRELALLKAELAKKRAISGS